MHEVLWLIINIYIFAPQRTYEGADVILIRAQSQDLWPSEVLRTYKCIHTERFSANNFWLGAQNKTLLQILNVVVGGHQISPTTKIEI